MSGEKSTEVAVIDPAPTSPVAYAEQPTTPADFLALAIRTGDLEMIREMRDLYREGQADQARREYTAAMAAFKGEDLTIVKDKYVKFNDFWHATLGTIVAVVAPALGRHGLSASWDLDQVSRPGEIGVTSRITHSAGHSEQITIWGVPDKGGNKTANQAILSTKTLFERHGLLALMGLATVDQEDADDTSKEKPKSRADSVVDGFRKLGIMPNVLQGPHCMGIASARWTDAQMDEMRHVFAKLEEVPVQNRNEEAKLIGWPNGREPGEGG